MSPTLIERALTADVNDAELWRDIDAAIPDPLEDTPAVREALTAGNVLCQRGRKEGTLRIRSMSRRLALVITNASRHPVLTALVGETARIAHGHIKLKDEP